MRKVIAVSGGVFSTFWLFVFMASLISNKHIANPTIQQAMPDDFFPSKFEEKIPTPRAPLPKPEPVKKTPTMPTQGILPVDGPTRPNAPVVPVGDSPLTKIIKWHPPVVNPTSHPNDEETTANGVSNTTTPVAQMPPMYPRELAQQGIQGWVKLRFHINEQGEPIDIVVIDAKPKSVFNRAAVASIAKWRYRPAMSDGKTIISAAQEIVLDFKLEN